MRQLLLSVLASEIYKLKIDPKHLRKKKEKLLEQLQDQGGEDQEDPDDADERKKTNVNEKDQELYYRKFFEKGEFMQEELWGE